MIGFLTSESVQSKQSCETDEIYTMDLKSLNTHINDFQVNYYSLSIMEISINET